MTDEHLNRRLDNVEQSNRDTWLCISEIREQLRVITVSTACIPELVDEIRHHRERLDAADVAMASASGEARANAKASARLIALASSAGAALGVLIGPIVDWLKNRP